MDSAETMEAVINARQSEITEAMLYECNVAERISRSKTLLRVRRSYKQRLRALIVRRLLSSADGPHCDALRMF